MCWICKRIKETAADTGVVHEDVPYFLDRINDSIKGGTSPSHFDEVMDLLLNTEMPERDEFAEEMYEHQRRGDE